MDNVAWKPGSNGRGGRHWTYGKPCCGMAVQPARGLPFVRTARRLGCEISIVSTTDCATIWSATEPFRSPLMNSFGSNGDTVFVAINSLPWMD